MNNRWRDNLIALPKNWGNGSQPEATEPRLRTEAPTGVEFMARTPKATDTAAQVRKANADSQKREDGALAVGDQEDNGPTAAELIKDNPKVFGEEEGEAGKAEEKTPRERQMQGNVGLTADEEHAARNDGKTLNEAAKTEGRQLAIHDRVILTTATPIGGQTDNPAYVIGFNALTGLPNLRLENIDGSMGRPMEFGGVPQGAAREERGPFWRYAEEFEHKASDKADDKE